jgi:Na+/H+-dicarboxylate symporter
MKICKESLGMSDFGTKVALPIAYLLQVHETKNRVWNTTWNVCHIFFIYWWSHGISGSTRLILNKILPILQSIHIPSESLGLLLGIDRFMDMLRTTLNITGDVATAMIIDHSEKKNNYSIYYKK